MMHEEIYIYDGSIKFVKHLPVCWLNIADYIYLIYYMYPPVLILFSPMFNLCGHL